MMKRTMLLSTCIFSLYFINALAQEKEEPAFYRNQIGIQFNPLINEQFFDFTIMNAVSSFRYGYRITKNITTGMDFSCYFPISVNSSDRTFQYYNYFIYRIGIVTRYSILSDKRFQIFAEASPFFSHYWRELTSLSDLTPFRSDKFGFYIAPGVTLYSKSRRVSFDLYYKFSNLWFPNGNKSVISYKVNYNF